MNLKFNIAPACLKLQKKSTVESDKSGTTVEIHYPDIGRLFRQ